MSHESGAIPVPFGKPVRWHGTGGFFVALFAAGGVCAVWLAWQVLRLAVMLVWWLGGELSGLAARAWFAATGR